MTDSTTPFVVEPLLTSVRQRVLFLVMWAMMAFQALMATGFAYLYFESPWLSYANLPVPVLASPLHPGDVIPLYVVRCNAFKEARTYNTTRTLVRTDVLDETIILTGTVVSAKPGCEPITSRVNVLPIDTKPGRYRAAGKAQVEGTIRTHWVDWYSQDFEVVAKLPEATSGQR